MIENRIILKPLDEIIPDHNSRQRESAPKHERVVSLAIELTHRDLIHAIVVDKATNKLIVGAGRLEAFRYNRNNKVQCPNSSYKNWTVIPTRYAVDCTATEIQAIELVENIKRTDLTWREDALAVRKYHNLQRDLDDDWSGADTAAALGLSTASVSQRLQVAAELKVGNEKVAQCVTMSAALNIINRQNDRAIAAELELMSMADEEEPAEIVEEFGGNSIAEKSYVESEIIEFAESSCSKLKQPKPIQSRNLAAEQSILNLNFIEWIKSYEDQKFNFLHCDFPYGIDHQKSEQGGSAKWDAYDDSKDIYWTLLQALASHYNNILTHSCHIMFWYSADYEIERATREFFTQHMSDFTVQTFPMIWHKSDNKGLLPDANRYGRRTYETAMLLTRGDRKVVGPVALSYGAPTGTKEHLSMKPEPMLRHFFRMFVDEYTRLLDPTCGSATSLRAAESLGAQYVLGLELSKENYESACGELDKFRKLKALEA